MAALINTVRLVLLLVFLFVGSTIAISTPYDTATSQIEKRTVAVPGTELIDHSRKDLVEDGDYQGVAAAYEGLTCFSDKNRKCAPIDRHWAMTAADLFCKKVDGKVFDMKNQNSSTSMTYKYWPRSTSKNNARGSILMQIGIAPDMPADQPALTMDYSTCLTSLISNGPVDLCDSEGENHKYGGLLSHKKSRGNDHLFYLLDPNPYDEIKGREWCVNDYWIPYPSNTLYLGTIPDQCLAVWKDVSPVDTWSDGPRDWDCKKPGFSTDAKG